MLNMHKLGIRLLYRDFVLIALAGGNPLSRLIDDDAYPNILVSTTKLLHFVKCSGRD